jgi:hypothetical protein
VNADCVDILAIGGLDLADLDADKCALCRWQCADAKDATGRMLDGLLYCAQKCQFPPEGCQRPANDTKETRRNVYLFCYWAWQNADVREMLEHQARPVEVAA